MAYVDYYFYTQKYEGNSLNEQNFAKYERLARTYVNRFTFNRVVLNIQCHPDFKIPDEIKFAVCHVADHLYKTDQNGGEVVSETVGKHNVTYSQSSRSRESQIAEIVRSELSSTGWTYQGGGI